MLRVILTSLAFVSAILTILASYQQRRLTLYLFKPLTIIFVILIVFEPKHPTSLFYRYAIIIGLILSLVGDLFLMVSGDRFIKGLISSTAAQLLSTSAF